MSIMPCVAKKFEVSREELGENGYLDTDISLTTRELARMIKEAGIDFNELEDEKADSPFGEYSGAATIFGASGGVAEAAARTAYYYVTGENIADNDIKEMRGVDANSRSKSVELDIKGTKVVVRVVSTLLEAEKAIKEIKSGKVEYRLDKSNIIHLGFGKVSFGADKLFENYETVMDAIIKAKPAAAKGQYIKSIAITTTMGPSIYVG